MAGGIQRQRFDFRPAEVDSYLQAHDSRIGRMKDVLKLDLGCGTRKRPGFRGVDSRKFEGVDVVADLREA